MQRDLQQLHRYHDKADASAFQSLVKLHAGMVFATARRVTGNDSLAEDVAQETFLELARKGQRITSSVGAWLHRVASRRACDAVRSESARRRTEASAAILDEGRECTWEEMEPVLDEALGELGEQERTAIIEHFLEARTQAEVAARLGVSQSTVSRLLDSSLVRLRERLRAKGMICGAGLGAVIMQQSTLAAPHALVAGLNKIALSGIGANASSVGWLTIKILLASKAKVALGITVGFLACAVGVDLASHNSWLMSLMSSDSEESMKVTGAAQKLGRSDKVASSNRRQQLLAEARAIWAKAPQFSQEQWQELISKIYWSRGSEVRFMALHAIGITLSRTSYNRVMALHPNVDSFDERTALKASLVCYRALTAEWFLEAPREAVAWELALVGRRAGDSSWVLSVIADWIKTHPEEWEAFVEAGNHPQLSGQAKAWTEELDNSGSIWTKITDNEIKLEAVEEAIYQRTDTGDPEMILNQILRAPREKFRHENIVRLAPRLSTEQLLRAINSGQFSDGSLVNMLRAMAGIEGASYAEAAKRSTDMAKRGGMEAEQANAHSACIGRIYSAWLKTAPKEALRQAIQSGNSDFLPKLMTESAREGHLTEEAIVTALSSEKNRDRALASFYLASADDNPVTALQSIIGSSHVVDQVEAAKSILEAWTKRSPDEAVQWLSALPASEDRKELAAVIASQWSEIEPEAAFAFAQQYEVGLRDDWKNAFGFNARGLPEAKLAILLRAVRDDPNYNIMLASLVGYRHPSQPMEAIAMLTRYGAPGWETALVDDTLRWLSGEDSRAEDYAKVLPRLNLSAVEPEKIHRAAKLFIQRNANAAKISSALSWTLGFPFGISQQARSEAIQALDLGDQSFRTAVQSWVAGAPLSADERKALQSIVAEKN
ncbi:MAG TPA: hypothetical protein DIT13_19000 [Verrucomicrobiales bacterium]|nr:hypothetical protein [Verrucomicrobiales bacterium]HRJ08705.1 sigma-70 family RNA polymerase sigma factor [Prosthecobacter sp.]HRK14022.1 sigma-70 family RNA polymerase sigma factor [Prosthecobacter sp.]